MREANGNRERYPTVMYEMNQNMAEHDWDVVDKMN